MKAVRIHEFGDESVLLYEDAPDPVPGPGQVLIRIRAAALNRGDLSRRRGGAQTPPALPFIIGWDAAGDVVSSGPGASGFPTGQRVVSLLPHGGYAELAVGPADLTVAIPDGVSYDEAAALPVAYLTAWVALLQTMGLKAGESCLIQAASSGVGMAAVQIAKHVVKAGLVITTAGSDDKVARAKTLGADHAINYSSSDFLTETMRLTNGRGVDVVLEVVGGDVFKRSQQALAEGGRLVSAGRSSGEAAEVDLELASRKHQIVTTTWGAMGGAANDYRADALKRILQLVKDGTLKVIIDKTFPLSQTAEAHRYLAGRNQFGKVLLHTES